MLRRCFLVFTLCISLALRVLSKRSENIDGDAARTSFTAQDSSLLAVALHRPQVRPPARPPRPHRASPPPEIGKTSAIHLVKQYKVGDTLLLWSPKRDWCKLVVKRKGVKDSHEVVYFEGPDGKPPLYRYLSLADLAHEQQKGHLKKAVPPPSIVSTPSFDRVNQYKSGDTLFYWASSKFKWYKLVVKKRSVVDRQEVLEFEGPDGNAPLYRYLSLAVLARKEQEGYLKKEEAPLPSIESTPAFGRVTQYKSGDTLWYWSSLSSNWYKLVVKKKGIDETGQAVLEFEGADGNAPLLQDLPLVVLAEKEEAGDLKKQVARPPLRSHVAAVPP